MTNKRLREADKLRRLAATQCEKWHSVGKEVYDENGTNICDTDTDARAVYIAALHNGILGICATIVVLANKQTDRLAMTKEQNDPRGKD